MAECSRKLPVYSRNYLPYHKLSSWSVVVRTLLELWAPLDQESAMFLGYRVVSLACLLVVPPVAAQTSHGSAPDTAHVRIVEAMKDDLRRLVKAEDAFLARNDTYTGVLPQGEFATRPERRVIVVAHEDKGYSATITTTEEPGLTCGLFDGIGVAPSPVISSARKPACWHSLPGGTIVGD